jgi:hypothetical protein
LFPAQHAWFGPPHVWQEPLAHTSLPVGHAAPAATHLFATVSQHPVPRHVVPLQQDWPVVPQVVHVPPAHTAPPLHVLPAATHCEVVMSQQPVPAQTLPLQHGWLGPPHV